MDRSKFIFCIENLVFYARAETFEKCSILFKFKKKEDFNHRHTISISRIEI